MTIPTDPSINLATSAAAAFCARLCVHPLDHFKASLQLVDSPPQQGLRLHLTHLLTTIRHHLHALHTTHSHHHHQQQKHNTLHHTIFREQLALYRRLYHGAPLALIINVPALAFFLSTYDATKHTIAFLASRLEFAHFQLHHFETHLISGMMAKVAGTIFWAPQAKLAGMKANHHGQLSLREAFQLVKKVVAKERRGVWSLWSGYGTTLTSLLPYTMLYFATYEKLKQFARLVIISREEQQQLLENGPSTRTSTGTEAGRKKDIDFWTDKRPLDLGTYMVCVAGAVAISATVCHTAGVLRVHIQDRWISFFPSSSVSSVKSAVNSATTSPLPQLMPSSSSSSSGFRTPAGSMMAAKVLAPALAVTTNTTTANPQQYHNHHHSVAQHANLTTITTSPMHSPRRPLSPSGTGPQLQRRKQQSGGGLWRRIGRGLGPRVMWTAPGVTLTTAGFEVFRNLALGVV